MANSWSMVENIDVAAAFRSLGIKVQSDKGHDTARGKSWARWSVCLDGNFPGTQIPVSPLVKAVRSGDIETIDPAHPILDSLAVLKIRHQLVDAVKNGTRYRIDIPASVFGSVLIKGNEPQSTLKPPHLKTGDIKLASCFVRLGMPLAKIEGTPPTSSLLLCTPGYELHGSPPVDAAALMPAFRALPKSFWATPAPETPPERNDIPLARLCSLMHTLWIRDRLHDYINGRTQNLVITSPLSAKRMMMMPEDTDGKTLDKCRRFMQVPNL